MVAAAAAESVCKKCLRVIFKSSCTRSCHQRDLSLGTARETIWHIRWLDGLNHLQIVDARLQPARLQDGECGRLAKIPMHFLGLAYFIERIGVAAIRETHVFRLELFPIYCDIESRQEWQENAAIIGDTNLHFESDDFPVLGSILESSGHHHVLVEHATSFLSLVWSQCFSGSPALKSAR